MTTGILPARFYATLIPFFQRLNGCPRHSIVQVIEVMMKESPMVRQVLTRQTSVYPVYKGINNEQGFYTTWLVQN